MPTPRRHTLRFAALAAVFALGTIIAMSGAGLAATETTFGADVDTYAAAGSPTRSYGSDPRLRLDVSGDGTVRISYVRFTVTGVSSVTRASLRLYATTAHKNGFTVHNVADNTWAETLTWQNAPTHSNDAIAASGPLEVGKWVSLDVSSAVRGNGTYSFAMMTSSTADLYVASRDGGAATAPQLVVETSSGSSGTTSGGTTTTSPTTTAPTTTAPTTTAPTTTGTTTGTTPGTTTTAPPRDTTSPTMPATLSKTGSTESAVSLAWSGSTDNVGVAGYGVYRDGALMGITSGTSYTVGGSSCGKTHTFAVDAYDSAGNRSTARSMSASTNACPTPAPLPPSAGSNLSLPARAIFYYPWFPETWTVGGQHVKYQPTLGYYHSSNEAVARSHVQQLGYGGFQAAIASWWGTGTHSEATRLPLLLNTTSSMGSNLKWAVYHEMEGSGNPSVSSLQSDLAYLASQYASHPAYARVDGKPVIFVYNAGDNTCEVADRWKQAAGDSWYVVLKVFSGFRNCTNQPSSWHQYGPSTAASVHLPWSYNISPGFWRADESSPRLPRDLNRWQTNVRDMVASGAQWQLVTSFSEWGEGTAIESAVDWASASGYGSYLDALHTNGSATPVPAPPPPSTDTTRPSTPTGLTATGATTSSLSVTWNASTDNVGVSGYTVYRDGAAVGSTTQRTYTVNGLTCGRSYNVAVDAYDAANNRSLQVGLTLATSACPANDQQAPTMPSNLRPTAATASSVAVAWNASTDNVGVMGYRVHQNGGFVTNTTSTSFSFGSLTCGTSYTFGVDAFDAAGNLSGLASITTATAACPTPPSSGNPVIAVAGDIAGDGTGDSATAALLDAISPTAVLTTGDNAYPDGTASDYTNYYAPTWGRHKAKTYPAPGNHDYLTSGAAGYFGYFGARAGDPSKGYYSYDLGSWHLIALNSEISRDAGSPQVAWLKSDLAANGTRCVLAYWHKPRFSAGNYSDRTEFQPFWEALYAANADVVLNGHDHNYQRFVPMTPTGVRDDARGVREFVVGTGGRSHYAIRADSRRESADGATYGVLKLTLRADGYDWQFLSEAGRTFTDSGSSACH